MKQLDKQSTEDRQILDLEAMGFKCIKVLGRYNYRKMKEKLEMHKHDAMLEICFLEKGTQYYNVEGNDYQLHGGDVLLTFPGEVHGTKSYPEGKGRLFWLIIHIPNNKQRLLNLSIKETNDIVEKLLQLKRNRLFRASQYIKNDLNRIFSIYQAEQTIFNKIKITNLLLNFLLNVIEFGEKSSDNTVSKEIIKICKFISANLDDELKLEMLAEKMNLSLSHFKYRFKKEIGTPPTDYILRKKVAKAQLLLSKSKTIHDVAYELAFSSPSYFATVFKRYTGNTPSMYLDSK